MCTVSHKVFFPSKIYFFELHILNLIFILSLITIYLHIFDENTVIVLILLQFFH